MLSGNSGGGGFLGERLCGRLLGARNRDRPAIVADDEDGRSLPDACHVERLGDVAFRGGAVSEDADGGSCFAAQQEGQCHSDGMRCVRGDRDTVGKILAWAGKIVAALVASPIQEQLLERDPTPKLCAMLAETRQQDILRLHGGRDPDRYGFLAER